LTTPTPSTGLTVKDVARRYRVSPEKVRAWIGRGELVAINTAAALCGKPRWVVPPENLVAFERRRQGGPEPATPPRRRRPVGEVDYFADIPDDDEPAHEPKSRAPAGRATR
jgi:hypothetical protein